MRLDTERLARMGKARSRTRGLRSITLETGVSVYLPTPRDLAALIVPSEHLELFQRPGGISVREQGSEALGDALAVVTVAEVSEELVKLCAALPPRDDEGPAYNSLRHLGEHNPERLRRETLEAASLFRRSLPAEPKPQKAETTGTRTAPKTTAQRVAEHRARRRHAEVASSAWWLEDFIADEDSPAPGERILGTTLYEQASDALEDLDGERIDDEDDTSPFFAVPGPRVFYDTADKMLGPRKRSKQGVIYTMPEKGTEMKQPLFTREELLAEMARQELATMREAAAATETTETTGNVVPFARRRTA